MTDANGPDDFPGTDEGSHYCAQTRAADILRGHGDAPPEQRTLAGVDVSRAVNRPKKTRDVRGVPLPAANTKRQTGRTTHQLQLAIEGARLGRRVLYVVPTTAFVPYAVGLLRKLAHDACEWPAEPNAWRVGSGCIVFRFVQLPEALAENSPLLREVRGGGGMLAVDHAVWEAL